MTKMPLNVKTMNTEIERKFLIQMPDVGMLARAEGCRVSLIRQTYLLREDGSERVRARLFSDRLELTHTVKNRISPISAFEDERTINNSEYLALLARRDPSRDDIFKTRFAFPYEGHVFEIDVYPFWHRQAVMEVELESECEEVEFPPFISIIREVSGDRSYSNKSLSTKIPEEDK